MKGFAIALAVLGAVGLTSPAHADQGDVIAVIYDRAAAHGQSGAAMERLARCESRLDPNAVGDRGHSLGLFQLHISGLLPLFRQWGYDDPLDAWQSSDFTARALAAGMQRHWSCWGR